ncbi:MAG: hypothetical protein ACE5KM_15955 [Planctomycetaceae bacterium]
MIRHTLALQFALPLLLVAGAAHAQTSYPMLMSLKPTAAQLGKTSTHTVYSRYTMHGADRVLITGQGVTGEIVTPMKPVKPGAARPNLTKIQIQFTVAPNATPGVRDFRIATPNGVSTLGQLVIVRDPIVVEKGKNNTAATAQRVTLPATLCGAIERNEDVDYFKFAARAGQSLTFHVRSMRLQDRIHDLQKHADPIIAIRNAAGSTLAQSDNHFAADPLLTHRFPSDGEYVLEIRDVRYHGNTYWEYCVEVNDRPFLTTVHPMGVAKGESVELRLVGRQLPKIATAQFDPAQFKPTKTLPAGPRTVQLKLANGQLANPVTLIVSDLPQSVEQQADNNSPKTAQRVMVPGGISGRIETAADVDDFVFDAKKGETFTFEVLARRYGSELDSHLRILDAKTGRQLALNDDMQRNRRTFSDSKVENFSAPADGRYVIEIRDLHLRGGDDYTYYVRAVKSEPTFELYLDTDKTQLTPGTSAVIFVRCVRKNGFTGEIQLAVEGLPKGVTAVCGRIPAGKPTDGCIVLTAAKTAKRDVANTIVTGTASIKAANGKPRTIRIAAVPQQETYMPGGGRSHWQVDMHTVAVGAPSDIRAVTLSTYDVTLKPGESKRIDVTIRRAPGFNKNITLDMLFRHLSSRFADTLPAGVTIDGRNSRTLLTGQVAQGHITLKAAADAAPIEKRQVSVMANISLNFVMKATYSAKPLFVTVGKK